MGLFLALFLPVMLLSLLFVPLGLADTHIWRRIGSLPLFLGLLPLINVPFDWLALGVTRGLLRRGLERGGLWPYLYGMIDAALAVLLIAALALAMVVGVQGFDTLALAGGGWETLPMGPLLDGITAHPWAPEYWWAYFLLFSTMIPSLINLTIGGVALSRGIPWITAWVYACMPEGRNPSILHRNRMALGLTGQWLAGIVFALIAQGLLVLFLLFGLRFIGLDLLSLARGVAAFNLPAHIAMWL